MNSSCQSQNNQNFQPVNLPQNSLKQSKLKARPGKKMIRKKQLVKKSHQMICTNRIRNGHCSSNLNCHEMSIEETTKQIDNSQVLFKQAHNPANQNLDILSCSKYELQKNSNSDIQLNQEYKQYSQQIYSYLQQKQSIYIPNVIINQSIISENNRTKLLIWIFELGKRFRFSSETVYCAINIIDRYLGLISICLDKLPLLGITGLFMATKYQEIMIPHLSNFIAIVPHLYKVTTESVMIMESQILSLLNFNLGYSSPLIFIHYFNSSQGFSNLMKDKAISIVKQLILRTKCRYWPASKLANQAIQLAEKDNILIQHIEPVGTVN